MPLNIFWPLLAPLAALATQPPQAPAVPPITLPTVIVTAQKEPADAQRLPVSVTAVPESLLSSAGVTAVSDAAPFSPNTRFAEMSARKISNAFVRGIGSSPLNPGITTFIDGVPQLNSNTSNVALLDLERIEFVRGPQSALFGRNTLGGLVSIVSARPSLSGWTGSVGVPYGTSRALDVRAAASGPISSSFAVGVSAVRSRRDGFTTNDVTGRLVDSRSSTAGKVQALWVPAAQWDIRLIGFGEAARDGDYGFGDLALLRQRPLHVARDFEGSTRRDVWSATALVRHDGRRVVFSSTSGYVSWSARDITDLDYTPMPLMTRDNAERARQCTEELRLASAPGAPVRVTGHVSLAWQAGLFLFSQRYRDDAVNSFAAGVLSPMMLFPVSQHSPRAALDDTGAGLYAQGTLTFASSFDVSAGARFDTERKTGALETFYSPVIAPPQSVNAERSYSDVSPQAAVSYRLSPGRMLYVSAGRGFKAGGFNPASPGGRETYGQEHAWNLEAGAKTAWADGRVLINASAFRIAWDDMQLNVPNPQVPGQFYIANVGRATSTGVELEVTARPASGVDLIAAAGLNRARFGAGSTASGLDIAGHDVPYAPRYTASVGVQYSFEANDGVDGYSRADVVFTGGYRYDESNGEGQAAYAVVNIRIGLHAKHVVIDAWLKNALDTHYIPLAIPYGQLAPSGYLGESGRPRTAGVSLGYRF